MKRTLNLFVIVAVLFAIASCTSAGFRGQLTGVNERPSWQPRVPYGMIYCPTGVLHIGPNDQDVNAAFVQRSKQVSIQGFYMDETEITNNEYRQFVYWVRDSIAHTVLEHFNEEDDSDEPSLDWDMEIDWESEDAKEQLDELYYPENQSFGGEREIDITKMVYKYFWEDIQEAARIENFGADRSDFFQLREVMIHPDPFVWVRDFTYSYNEPMTRNYFNHVAFDDYPVVGVTWPQAEAFSNWRTKMWETYQVNPDEAIMGDFRLPTEHEWEYGARGGLKQSPYPWGGPYVRNSRGCLLANFKPGRGNYPEDGGLYTVKSDAYWPNDYGLYNMAGNVAEWTSSAYFQESYSFIHDLNSDMRFDADGSSDETMKRKVIRGGSWKDIGYYIQNGTRHYEYQDSAKSFVGFRNVVTFLGRDQADVF